MSHFVENENLSDKKRLTVDDGHIDGVLTNPHSLEIRCLHNACLKVFDTFKSVITRDVNDNWGGLSNGKGFKYIQESSLAEGHIVVH